MDSDERRAMVERVRRRALAEGGFVDQGAELTGWLDKWTAGEIDIDGVMELYAARQRKQSGGE